MTVPKSENTAAVSGSLPSAGDSALSEAARRELARRGAKGRRAQERARASARKAHRRAQMRKLERKLAAVERLRDQYFALQSHTTERALELQQQLLAARASAEALKRQLEAG